MRWRRSRSPRSRRCFSKYPSHAVSAAPQRRSCRQPAKQRIVRPSNISLKLVRTQRPTLPPLGVFDISDARRVVVTTGSEWAGYRWVTVGRQADRALLVSDARPTRPSRTARRQLLDRTSPGPSLRTFRSGAVRLRRDRSGAALRHRALALAATTTPFFDNRSTSQIQPEGD